jgi:hypothetical protein
LQDPGAYMPIPRVHNVSSSQQHSLIVQDTHGYELE